MNKICVKSWLRKVTQVVGRGLLHGASVLRRKDHWAMIELDILVHWKILLDGLIIIHRSIRVNRTKLRSGSSPRNTHQVVVLLLMWRRAKILRGGQLLGNHLNILNFMSTTHRLFVSYIFEGLSLLKNRWTTLLGNILLLWSWFATDRWLLNLQIWATTTFCIRRTSTSRFINFVIGNPHMMLSFVLVHLVQHLQHGIVDAHLFQGDFFTTKGTQNFLRFLRFISITSQMILLFELLRKGGYARGAKGVPTLDCHRFVVRLRTESDCADLARSGIILITSLQMCQFFCCRRTTICLLFDHLCLFVLLIFWLSILN